jgi:type I restriction enzyme M protein
LKGLKGAQLPRVSFDYLKTLKIPLPPLSVQQEIVAEIAAYQKIIDGARQVVENYKPRINVDKSWEMVELGEVSETSAGGTPLKERREYYTDGKVPWLRSGEVSQGFIHKSDLFITGEGLRNSSAKVFPINTVLVAMYGATAGQVGLLKFEAATNQAICGILPTPRIIPEYLFYFMRLQTEHFVKLSAGGAQPNISQTIIKKMMLPIPPLKIQKQIVAQIEEEQKLIEANKKLIEIFEEKIKAKIAEVWGEEAPSEMGGEILMAAEEPATYGK